MAKLSILLLLFFFFFLRLSQAHHLAPALYVFGDSTIDSGNNNHFNTYAKTNYPPYGIDFPSGVSTGRPTNGYNIADFFAKWLGLNVPLSFRLVNSSTKNIHQGFNYGSSSAGILPNTASMFKCVMSLGEQVDLFQKTVDEYLLSHFQSHDSLSEHVSKSIYLVVVGVNDIGLKFLSKGNISTDPLDYLNYVNLLVEQLGNHLKDLYKFGARKFLVFEIEALGCMPFYVNKFKPVNSKCVDYLNAVAFMYNSKLTLKLQELQFKLEGSTFILGKYYEYTLSLVENPSLSGLKDASNPCCVVLPFGLCDPNKSLCRDRNSHAFFDAFHPTEAAYKVFAERCFSGIGSCIPINVKQLAIM